MKKGYMDFLTVDEFAKVLKVCPHTVRKLIRAGKIYAVRPGLRQYRIPATELERLTIMSMFKEDK
jgi:excisionase family DNA binding protein